MQIHERFPACEKCYCPPGDCQCKPVAEKPFWDIEAPTPVSALDYFRMFLSNATKAESRALSLQSRIERTEYKKHLSRNAWGVSLPDCCYYPASSYQASALWSILVGNGGMA